MVIKLNRDNFKWTNGRGHDQKPILYSQKNNTLGLGKNPHSSDQWWLKAFDAQLSTLSVSTAQDNSITVKQTAPAATALGMARTASYYIRFVKGGVLTGSLEKPIAVEESKPEIKPEIEEVKTKLKKKKEGKKKKGGKGGNGEKVEKQAKEERRARKRMKRLVEKELAALKMS
ncbi:hypothetical protein RUND412_007670 [Rhizina undulata]